MRRYTTDHISKLIEQKREELGILKLAEQYSKLETIWKEIPDPTLQRLEIEHEITQEGKLRVLCSSSVALTYLRGQRSLLERELAQFMDSEGLSTLEIVLRSKG